jgi:hypothetical protein
MGLIIAPLHVWGSPDDRALVSQLFGVTAPSGVQIEPRYSTIDDVVKILGKPSRREYYKQGGEDFEWEDFWIYYYHADDLRIYFENKTRKVIRVFAFITRLKNFHFPLGIENGVDLDKLMDRLSRMEGITTSLRNNWILYAIKSSDQNGTLSGSIADMGGPPDDQLDLYYSSPWKGY